MKLLFERNDSHLGIHSNDCVLSVFFNNIGEDTLPYIFSIVLLINFLLILMYQAMSQVFLLYVLKLSRHKTTC